ncbi:SAM-dependent methyltransferase [Alteribacter lacisalsi]|uniref:SAM-dependent methyltransferase n=1 Tax=Alteribacter lacisalsi TaxID=2045244 RepID=A0A2W0HHC9_9BACI|nr:class I SAM-dependent methyltransferase [Alteribacter lacisalsi]PYZ96835.1 SAM-dependent methyltransferase [Alteribacter lacisalsi]
MTRAMSGERFDPAKADRLLSAERRELIDPEWITGLVELGTDEAAADLGAGNGFFTMPLAEKTTNDVYAVDIEAEMLGMLGVRMMEAGHEHVGLIEADLEDVPLADECVNGIVAGFVVHEASDRMKAFGEMKRLLKPGGKAAVAEWKKESFTMGPPEHERLDEELVSREMTEAGFRNVNILRKERIYVVTGEK